METLNDWVPIWLAVVAAAAILWSTAAIAKGWAESAERTDDGSSRHRRQHRTLETIGGSLVVLAAFMTAAALLLTIVVGAQTSALAQTLEAVRTQLDTAGTATTVAGVLLTLAITAATLLAGTGLVISRKLPKSGRPAPQATSK